MTPHQLYKKEGLESLYNPHAATGEVCGCTTCYCCKAYRVFKKVTSPRQQFLASQGIFEDVERIEIIGRVWYDCYGEPYHTTVIKLFHMDNTTAKEYKTKFAYGGGNQYEDSAYEFLFVDSWNTREFTGMNILCGANDIRLNTTKLTVKRKKDL